MEAIFLKLLNMSITASWLVVAVVLLRLIFKNAPKIISLILWALVGIRLILPFSFESVFSLIPSAQTFPSDFATSTTPTINSGIPPLDSNINPIIPQAPVIPSTPGGTQIFGPSTNPTIPQVPGTSTGASPLETIVFIASIVWVAGVAAMLLYALISYIRLRLKVREAVKSEGNIMLYDNIASPFILGLIRPKIYIPSSTDIQDVYYVLAHENAHLKRRDHFWKPLGFLLLSVYWFNPVLWVAYILLCRDIELACDEKVIKSLGIEAKKPYSTALVNCSVSRKAITVCPLAFGEVGVKRRVKTVLNYKKPAFWIIIVALIICAVVAVCFLTNPQNDDNTTTTTTTTNPNEEPPKVVKYVYIKEHRTQHHNGGSTSNTTYEYTYDEKGQLVKQLDYDENGNIVNKYEYEYNENGTLIYEVVYLNNAKFQECRYDSHGNLTSEIIYDRDGSIFSSRTHTYTYDNKYYEDGSLNFETCYIDSLEGFYYSNHYDLLGNMVHRYLRGESYTVIDYEYDKNGTCIYSYEQVDHAASKESRYDSNGNLISETVYDHDTSMKRYEDVYEYDEHNNCTKDTRYYADGRVVQMSRTEYTYDENGVVKAKIGYNEDGSLLFEVTYSEPFKIYE